MRDGDRRRNAFDALGLGLLQPFEKLPGIGGEAVDVAALTLGIKRVEGETGLATAAQARDHDQSAMGNVEVNLFKVMRRGAAHSNPSLGHRFRLCRIFATHARGESGHGRVGDIGHFRMRRRRPSDSGAGQCGHRSIATAANFLADAAAGLTARASEWIATALAPRPLRHVALPAGRPAPCFASGRRISSRDSAGRPRSHAMISRLPADRDPNRVAAGRWRGKIYIRRRK